MVKLKTLAEREAEEILETFSIIIKQAKEKPTSVVNVRTLESFLHIPMERLINRLNFAYEESRRLENLIAELEGLHSYDGVYGSRVVDLIEIEALIDKYKGGDDE